MATSPEIPWNEPLFDQLNAAFEQWLALDAAHQQKLREAKALDFERQLKETEIRELLAKLRVSAPPE